MVGQTEGGMVAVGRKLDPVFGPLVHDLVRVGMVWVVGGLKARVQEGGCLVVAADALSGVLGHALDDVGRVELGGRVAVSDGVHGVMDSEDPNRSSGEVRV